VDPPSISNCRIDRRLPLRLNMLINVGKCSIEFGGFLQRPVCAEINDPAAARAS
jgi:hypothetical protein